MRKTVSGFFKIEPDKVTFSPVRFETDRLPKSSPTLDEMVKYVEDNKVQENMVLKMGGR